MQNQRPPAGGARHARTAGSEATLFAPENQQKSDGEPAAAHIRNALQILAGIERRPGFIRVPVECVELDAITERLQRALEQLEPRR